MARKALRRALAPAIAASLVALGAACGGQSGAGASAPAAAPTGSSAGAANPASDEARFALALLDAAYAGEQELAELAEERAESERLAAHARDLIDDYERLRPEVAETAEQVDVDLDDREGVIAQVERELGRVYGEQAAMLGGLEGQDFDRAYLDSLVGTHEATLAEIRRIERRIDEDEPRDLVSDHIPAIERHLERARDVADREGIELDR